MDNDLNDEPHPIGLAQIADPTHAFDTAVPDDGPALAELAARHTGWGAVRERVSRAVRDPNDAEIFAIVGPALLAVFLDPVMTLVDTAIVGRLGAAELGGTGLASLIWNFSSALFAFLAVATTPKVAVHASKGEDAEASRVIGTTVVIAAGIGLALGAFYFGMAPVIAERVASDPAVVPHAAAFLRFRSLAGPFSLVQYVCIGAFRGFRNTRTPLLAALFSNLFNLSGDLFFIYVLKWGVAGAAAATSISQVAGCGILLTLLVRERRLAPPDLARLPDWGGEVMPILRTGVLLAFRTVTGLAAILSATYHVNRLGAVSLAAHEISRQLWLFSMVIYDSLSIAAQSLVAIRAGRGDTAAVGGVVRRLLQLALTWSVLVGIALWAAQGRVVGIFTRDAAVTAAVMSVWPLLTVFQPLDACATVLDGTLYGAQAHGFVAKAMGVSAAVCIVTIWGGMQVAPSLLTVWLGLKVLSFGRPALAAYKLRKLLRAGGRDAARGPGDGKGAAPAPA